MSKKRDPELLDVLRSASFAHDIFKILLHAVLAEEGGIQHLRRLCNEPKLVKSIARQLVPPRTYSVHVAYGPMPSVEELENRFSGEGSTFGYYGGPWKRHESCVNIDETPGERIFRLAEVPERFHGLDLADTWGALARYFDRLGERFAIDVEAIEFADANPDIQLTQPYLALGSWDKEEKDGVAVVKLSSSQLPSGIDTGPFYRILDDEYMTNTSEVWDAKHRLLVVRK